MNEYFSGNVKWEILGIDDAANEAQILGNEVVAVIHDENATDVQLDVVLGFLVLKQIERSAFGHVE